MKFSVLIPVYNGSATLERSIGSVLRQTTDSYELICCNDGSTDDSLEVLHKYAAQDARIKIVSHEQNKGSICARNTLIKEFSGEYCVWLDQDDELEPDFLQTAEEILEKEDWDIVHFRFKFRYSDGSESLPEWNFFECRDENLIPCFFGKMNFHWSLWGRAIKKQVMKSALAPEIRSLTDDVFFALPMLYAAKSYYAPQTEPKMTYYADIGIFGSMTRSISLDKYRQLCKLRREMYQYCYDFLTYHKFKFEPYALLLLCDVGLTLWQSSQLEKKEDREAALAEFQKYFSLTITPRPYNMPFHPLGCEPKKSSYSFVAPKIKM